MKLFHTKLKFRRLERSFHVSPLNISERSLTATRLTVHVPSVETESDFFSTLKPLNKNLSFSKLICRTKPEKYVKIKLAKLELNEKESEISIRKPKIVKSKTNLLSRIKTENSENQVSNIRMPLPQSCMYELDKIRRRRLRSNSRQYKS